ncbi:MULTISPECIES: AI-2E family transporter [Muribaculum]|uniref:AI-2E family transporter n=2 Tax=Muribaculaceae TaxID=2005473 RepID=UPI000F4731E8|nr:MULTISPECIES: AI-2E family transporter [Muribaculum]MCX4276818.1 AI-2E family transporter [Muribaculum sp.]ROT13491.1 AI-2E family transporter [Muribaculaceae bacterium Isolate-102 (HZI)]TGY03573.1 AI-2E family transporter [Muribaculum sp. NM65_B17]THG42556.1 AI-2E family transporter [Muribaculaceae bacterium]
MQSKVSSRYWTVDRIMWLVIGLAMTAALIYLVRYLSNVLLPFFVACFIAYILQPIVNMNRRLTRTKGRVIPSILTLVDMAVVIALVVYIFLPSVLKELNMLGGILKSVSSGDVQLPKFYVTVVDFINKYFNPDNISGMLDGSHIEALLSKGSSLLEESIGVVMEILSWLLTLIYILFILIDYPQISRGFKLIIPHKYRPRTMVVVRDVENSMNHYFRGQGVVAMCAAVFYCIGFSIVGLPLAIPMGIIVGVLYMIPYFQYVTLIPVAAICFVYSLGGSVEFLPEMGKCLLVYVVSQCICDYVITPHIMGKEMGLNPAIILLSLSVWGSLLGIIGMIIALPVTALIMTYYERYVSNPAPETDESQPAEADKSGPTESR